MLETRQTAHGTIGAQVVPFGVNYRTWAPDARKVEVRASRGGCARRTFALVREDGGYWSGTDFNGAVGDLYGFCLDNEDGLPDVASRFQPHGIGGRSECIDPGSYAWTNSSWERPAWRGQTTYEIHVGTFTPEGTFRAAIPMLAHIRDLGAEAVEIMPVADFAGDRNWGYDGVCLFAPARCYGRPDDLRALVDAAHGHGLAVILDVVYNHVGPQSGYFASFCRDYFRNEQHTPWGRSFNLDGPRSWPVRDLIRNNAAYWLDEYRFDGLRLDATHAIRDASPNQLIGEIADIAHVRGGFVIAEDERNTAKLLGPGLGLDAAWADDFHHQVRVALTGTRDSYFSAYSGKPEAIADTISNGWTYRGQAFAPWQGKPRGEASRSLPTDSFIYCIENHDQVGNRPFGERLENLVDPARFRAASMLLCLCPYPVLLFMGQDWAASTPFLFFCNHGGELGENISKRRQAELGSGGSAETAPPDPEDPLSFRRSKLLWAERPKGRHAETLSLYRACLRERLSLHSWDAFSRESWSVVSEGPVIAVKYSLPGSERLLLVNFQQKDVLPESLPELFCKPQQGTWSVVLDSESPDFGGCATEDSRWTLRGPGALWFEAPGKDMDGTH
jgi:maltooligosyltrehalose trehalohydrolase